MDENAPTLQVLIANERDERLDLISNTVVALGHDVIARSTSLDDLGPLSRRVHADVEAACPVIAVLDADDPAIITDAAKRGVFAYVILDGRKEDLENALDITLRRFAEFMNLQGAFGRRALIEQAKGILMARHAIDEQTAFERLRDHSQHTGRKLVDVADAVVESHLLLLPHAQGALQSTL
jgi:response regulator NasT